jgi:hypothetical protein
MGRRFRAAPIPKVAIRVEFRTAAPERFLGVDLK